MPGEARLLDRVALRAYLGGLPWAEIAGRIEAGRLPRPLWGLALEDKRARWDRRAVDRALDDASGVPVTVDAASAALDRALGFA